MPKRKAAKPDLKERIPICPHGDKDSIDQLLVAALRSLERKLRKELTFTSGFRCPGCNAEAGGVPNSAHLRGLAVDIQAGFSTERFAILAAAFAVGFRRIGVGRNFIHLDVDPSLPQDRLWLY